MRARWLWVIVVAACGGSQAATPVGPDPDPTDVADQEAPTSDDPRVVQLRAMTELLAILSDQVAAITAGEEASDARCAKLTAAVYEWGAEHYEDYETADGEGTYLGLTAADVDNAELRALAVKLARDSAILIEAVDEDCLYGDGEYGDALYEYLISYQGLEHWVNDEDTHAWDYEALMAESD
jgi:hypothetical protein